MQSGESIADVPWAHRDVLCSRRLSPVHGSSALTCLLRGQGGRRLWGNSVEFARLVERHWVKRARHIACKNGGRVGPQKTTRRSHERTAGGSGTGPGAGGGPGPGGAGGFRPG